MSTLFRLFFICIAVSTSAVASISTYAAKVGATVAVGGYVRKDGTYVAPYHRSLPDRSAYNNWSTIGNINPFTGKAGWIRPSATLPARQAGVTALPSAPTHADTVEPLTVTQLPLPTVDIAAEPNAALLDHLANTSDQIFKLGKERQLTLARAVAQRSFAFMSANVSGDHPALAYSLFLVAITEFLSEHYDRAISASQRAVAIWGNAGPDFARSRAQGLSLLSLAYDADGQSEEALRVLVEANGLLILRVGDSIELANNSGAIGLVHLFAGRYETARPYFLRALTLYEKYSAPDSIGVVSTLHNLGLTARGQRQLADAEVYFTRVAEIYGRADPVIRRDLAYELSTIAKVQQLQGRLSDAGRTFQRSLVLVEREYGIESPEFATAVSDLSNVQFMQGQIDNAERGFRRAMFIRERTLAADEPLAAQSMGNLAYVYIKQEKFARAESLLRQASAIQLKHPGANQRDLQVTLANLAIALQRQGRIREAAAVLEKSRAIQDGTQ